MQNLIFLACTILLAGMHQGLYGSTIIYGDVNSLMSFSQPIRRNAYHRGEGFFYVGSNAVTTGVAGRYAVSCAGPQDGNFTPLIKTENATINGSQSDTNPLYGAAIAHLALLGRNPVVINAADLTSIYIVKVVEAERTQLLKASGLVDALGQPVASVAALETNTFAQDGGEVQKGMAAFALVADGSGFGNESGALAVAALVERPGNSKELDFNVLGQTALTPATPALCIGGSLSTLGGGVLYRDPARLLLYIGVQGTSGTGMHGLIAAPSIAQVPTFSKLVADDVVGDDAIIATNGGTGVEIYHVGTMATSTMLQYLIVVGGVTGTTTNLQRSVYALPQLNATGGLASVNAVPVTTFSATYPYVLTGRTLTTAPTATTDLYRSTDVPAIVGGGAAPAGNITQMFVSGDAVFISVGAIDPLAGQQPGIWYSQALFDEYGRIKGWTNWQRASGSFESVWGFALDERSGNFWTMPGGSVTDIFTVKRSLWQRNGILQNIMGQILPPAVGSAQNLFTAISGTQATFAVGDEALSVLVGTGYKTVALLQTGEASGGYFGPTFDYNIGTACHNGSLAGFTSGGRWLSMDGGILDQLGAIQTAIVVTNSAETDGWLVVGGAGGLAVLTKPDGSGWGTLGSGFTGLAATMSWRSLGSFSSVRALAATAGFLYVLTDQQLIRIPVSAANLAQGASAATTLLAQAGQLPMAGHSFFSDLVVSDKFALLATSSGLLRVGNGSDISKATNSAEVRWTEVVVPEGAGPVSRLYPITPSGAPADLLAAGDLCGNLYVMSSFVGYHQTRLYRYTFSYTGTVTDSTMSQLPDYIVKDKPTFFINVGDYRNYMATDGAIFALSQSRYLKKKLFLEILDPLWRTRAFRKSIESANKVIQEGSAKHIGSMIRNGASGAWLVPTDQGLVVNE